MMTQETKEWVYVIPTVGGNVLTSLINKFVDNFLALLGLPLKDTSQSQFEILSVKYKPFYSQCILYIAMLITPGNKASNTFVIWLKTAGFFTTALNTGRMFLSICGLLCS